MCDKGGDRKAQPVAENVCTRFLVKRFVLVVDSSCVVGVLPPERGRRGPLRPTAAVDREWR